MNESGTGTAIDGFCLGEKIHVGSMATIYRLTGPGGQLPLIMKIPRLGAGERAVNVTAFEVCRTVLGALSQSRHHPTLVSYGDVETTPYLVMEYVEGVRLKEWLGRAPLPPQEIARLGSALALALQDLHLQDVVHLDLKPTNVLYRAGGEAVIIDFGLAHHSHFPDLFAEAVRFPVGNWVYMAPEQIFGVRCDPRSDIYALGGILYELATGRTPFGVPRSVAELRKRVYRDPVPPRALAPQTPEWLQEIILRCLEIDARNRYATAEQVAFDLVNPSRVSLTERALRRRGAGPGVRLVRRIRAARFKPAPCPPPSKSPNAAPVVVVALAPREGNRALLEAMLGSVRSAVAAEPTCRIACITVVPPAATLSGEGEEATATGRHIRRVIEMRRWCRPLELPEDRLTFHVLESEKPAAALVDYAKINEVDHVFIGAPRSSAPARLYTGVCVNVVAQVPCSVTVVRAVRES